MTAARALLVAALLAGCGDGEPAYLSRAELLDPETCMDCHPKHFDEWRASMHAYAADDPVFLAMNARGQRETGGELGDFCVNCHAPVAVREGLTTDGLNLPDLPRSVKGVTCFFCHSVSELGGESHNNPLVLADDLVMRGGFGDAIDNDAHRTGYSALLDGNSRESSAMCGSCHDIVTPAGGHVERTFAEYQESVFPDAYSTSCGDCHTEGNDDVVADVEGVPLRTRHTHGYPGIDLAITEWPGIDAQRALIAEELRTTLQARVCHSPAGNVIQVFLTNIGAGHMWPSGATQDRRAWVQLRAFTGETETFASGVVPEGGAPTELDDPNLWLLRDRTFDADGEETHMFWEAATYESELLPPQTSTDMNEPGFNHTIQRDYPLLAAPPPDRIELRVFIQAVGRDVLDDLIASGDLAAAFRDAMPTLTVAQPVDWTIEAAGSDRCQTLTEPPR